MAPSLETVETKYEPVFGLAACEWAIAKLKPERLPELTSEVTDQVQVRARVDHGRWIADCPFCPGAMLVSCDDPYFVCANCVNEEVGGRRVAVIWPDEGAVTAIEAALEVRPGVEVMNWFPDESVADLLAENEAHLPDVGKAPDLV